MQPIIDMQVEMKAACGKEKREFSLPEKDAALVAQLTEKAVAPLKRGHPGSRQNAPPQSGSGSQAAVFPNRWIRSIRRQEGEVYASLDDLQKQLSRDMIIVEGRRIDGRAFDEIRPITCEVGILPRPHGSALFTRGETQVLGVLTLGSGQDEQRVETLSGEEFRPFMLHYNFPPFSVGEVKRDRRPQPPGHRPRRPVHPCARKGPAGQGGF
jgi:polyribonucleotide nucleotidyltransferase